ncbi:MAG: tetratricopeptide repeat protein [Nitrospirae bacterium]|nr:tetratricopeptide repeat protein [Nitrospirota bacterium]
MRRLSGTRVRRAAWLAAAVWLALVSPAGAEAPPAPKTLSPDLPSLWAQHRESLRSPNPSQTTAEIVRAIRESQLDRGIQSLPAFSAALVEEARRAVRIHEYELAVDLLRGARDLAPDYPPVYFELARVYWLQNKLNALKVMDELASGVGAISQNFWWSFYKTGNFILLAITALFVSFFLGSLILLVRTTPLIRHALSEAVGGKVPGIVLAAVPWAMVVLPVVLGFGIAWAIILAALWMWVFLSRKEQVVVGLFVLFLALMPLALDALAVFVLGGSSPTVKVLSEVRDGLVSAESAAYLARADGVRTNPTLLLARGLVAKREGRLADAVRDYEAYAAAGPRPAAARNNLGNVYYTAGDLDRAAAEYREAVRIDPKLVTARYNLSQVTRELFRFDEGDQLYIQARELDAEAVSSYRRIAGPHPNRVVVDENLTLADLWKGVEASGARRVEVSEALWSRFMRGISLQVLPIFTGGLLVLVPLLGYTLGRRLSVPYACRKCGRVICDECQVATKERMCNACHQTLITMVGIDVKDRVRKILEIQKHRERESFVTRLLSFLLPGGGHILMGRTGVGILALFVVVLWVLTWLLSGSFLLVPGEVYRETTAAGTAVFLIVLGLFDLFIVRHAYRIHQT